MVKLSATALVRYISPVIQVSEKFQKRELVLDDSWTKDDKTYPNFILIEFTGDKMFLLDNFIPGQRVTVEAYVNGREHEGRYFNTLRGQSISLYQPPQTATQQPQSNMAQQVVQQPAPAPAGDYAPQTAYPQQPPYPQPAPYPQPTAYPRQGGYAQQPPYPQQGGYAQQPAPAPMPGTAQNNNLGPDGLPFR